MSEKSPLPEQDGPTFDPTTHWCPRHLEPFRKRWPQGWPLAMLALFDEAVRNDEIMAACGHDPEKGTLADTRMLDRVMREYAPLCCFLGDDITAKWTRLSLGPLDAFKAARDALVAGDGG